VTPLELKVCAALESVRFPHMSRVKIFAGTMTAIAKQTPEQDITLPQSHYLLQVAVNFRKQVLPELVEECRAEITRQSTLMVPKVKFTPKPRPVAPAHDPDLFYEQQRDAKRFPPTQLQGDPSQ
jgi:hypothetical protein